MFFMAPDSWHHLEGTYPERGLFRLYLYNDYTQPLAIEKLRQVTGRVVTKETFDREHAAFPLELAMNGQFLEARVDLLAPPAEMTAKIRLAPDGPEHRFDFAFEDFSKEPVGDVSTTSTFDPSQLDMEIPDSAAQVLTQLTERNQQLREIIDRGTFVDAWFPALQAKDLALALEARAKELPPDRQPIVARATRRLVIAAWRLDAFGDLGNRERIVGAYNEFAAAVKELEGAFAGVGGVQ
jgi:hypothetical protein